MLRKLPGPNSRREIRFALPEPDRIRPDGADGTVADGPQSSALRAVLHVRQSQSPHTPNSLAGSGTRPALRPKRVSPMRWLSYRWPAPHAHQLLAASPMPYLPNSLRSSRAGRHAQKNPRNLALQARKLHLHHRAPRMQHHIHARRQFSQMQAHRFSHTSPDPIAFHCAAQGASRRQPHARLRARRILARSCAKKPCHGWGRVAAAFLVDSPRVSADGRFASPILPPAYLHSFSLGEWKPDDPRYPAASLKGNNLIAITRAYGNTLAALRAPPRQHRGAALGLHAAAKAVSLRTAAAIRLECALRHGKSCLLMDSYAAGSRARENSLKALTRNRFCSAA
jgi:hypothetical protein